VYSFNSKSDTWWSQNQVQFRQLRASVFQFPWPQVQALAAKVNKTMDWSITITESTLFVSTEDGDCEVQCQNL
jgi:uncharacterized protein YaeQ